MKYLAVVPAYNEAKNISAAVRGIMRHLSLVIVVDDGSTDDTAKQAVGAGATVLKHSRNTGKGAALATGFEYALAQDCDAVITLDGDGQHDPLEIPAFIKCYEQHRPGMIIGTRMAAVENMPWLRKATNRFTSAMISMATGRRITDSQSGFRLLGADLLRQVDLTASKYDAETEIIIKACRKGFEIAEVPVTTIYHDNAKSCIHPVRDTIRFFSLLIRLRFTKCRQPDSRQR
ncbi:glycosyltransferase family 2 protein [Planctomycetota bacterium]